MGASNPLDPGIGLVAQLRLIAYLGDMALEPSLSVLTSANSHSMRHLPARCTPDTVHRFLCRKCNQLR